MKTNKSYYLSSINNNMAEVYDLIDFFKNSWLSKENDNLGLSINDIDKIINSNSKNIEELIIDIKKHKHKWISSTFFSYFKTMHLSYSLLFEKNYIKLDILKKLVLEAVKWFKKQNNNELSNLSLIQKFENRYTELYAQEINSKRMGNSHWLFLEKKINHIGLNHVNDFDQFIKFDCAIMKLNKSNFDKVIKWHDTNCVETNFTDYFIQSNNKIFDVIIKIRNHIFIIEQKIINELGGSQDKQILELVKISGLYAKVPNYNLHFVSCLSGFYWESLKDTNESKSRNKVLAQNKNIIKTCVSELEAKSWKLACFNAYFQLFL